jgi:hypothetical protein
MIRAGSHAVEKTTLEMAFCQQHFRAPTSVQQVLQKTLSVQINSMGKMMRQLVTLFNDSTRIISNSIQGMLISLEE